MNEDFLRPLRSLIVVIKAVFATTVAILFLFIIQLSNPNWLDGLISNDAQWQPRKLETDLKNHPKAPLIRLGHDVIVNTPEIIGPLAQDVEMRFAGNNLSCQNCHLDAGRKAGSASFIGVANRFPQYRGREDKMGNLIERVNGCMERSMNGEVLPENSLEMQAIIAYMEWLSEDVPEERVAEFKGFANVELPNQKADLVIGKSLYSKHCQLCHMENGQGQRPSETGKYLYPPLWGGDTYNHGAGMHRVITAAQFIKGNMPFLQATLENPVLTDEEAYHLAAYINSFERPLKRNPEVDFPDKSKKPVSTPYGPWVDPFSPDQHKYGPFQPIMVWYEKELGLKKSK